MAADNMQQIDDQLGPGIDERRYGNALMSEAGELIDVKLEVRGLPSRPLRILFLGGDMSRSGAPMVLLHLIRWLKENTAWAMSLATPKGGSMEGDFQALLPSIVCQMPPLGGSLHSRRLSRVLRGLGVASMVGRHRLRSACAVLPDGQYDLVYCNSVAAIGLVAELDPQHCPVIVHVHELQYVLENMFWVPDAITKLKQYATHYICCAEVVQNNLMSRHGVKQKQISVVHPCVDVAAISNTTHTLSVNALRARVEVPENAAVVGIVGTIEWRKGADLLVPLARALHKRTSSRRICFVWLGTGDSESLRRLEFDINTAGLTSDIKLAGLSQNVADWYRGFDVLALLSREDPFPLAALEAAAAGVPIICFEGAGGIGNFVREDAGRSIPYLDLDSFADALVEVVSNDSLRTKLGEVAASRVHDFDVSKICPQLRDVITKVVDLGACE